MKITIYDAEIKRAIVKRGEEKIPGIDYCDGFRDFDNMGVSTVCAYDYHTERYRVFCADNFEEFLHLLANSDLIVGFNNLGFDDPLLSVAIPGFDMVITDRYDLLSEIWVAAGLQPKWGGGAYGGYGLDAMCEVNFAVRKTGHGADAPIDWQRGKIGKVIDYCLNDIFMTKMLMDCAINGDELISPKGGTLMLHSPIASSTVHKLEDVLTEDSTEESDSNAPKGEVNVEAHNEAEAQKLLLPMTGDEEVDHHWDNLVIEIEQILEDGGDRMMVAVHISTGLLIKRKMMLHEWSNPTMRDAMIEKDGPAVIAYLREHEKLYERTGGYSGAAKEEEEGEDGET